MPETIIVALIGGLCTAIPSIIATIALNNKNQAIMETKMDDNQKFVEYKITELTKRVEQHNGLVERMALQERETNAIWKRIDEMKGKLKD